MSARSSLIPQQSSICVHQQSSTDFCSVLPVAAPLMVPTSCNLPFYGAASFVIKVVAVFMRIPDRVHKTGDDGVSNR